MCLNRPEIYSSSRIPTGLKLPLVRFLTRYCILQATAISGCLYLYLLFLLLGIFSGGSKYLQYTYTVNAYCLRPGVLGKFVCTGGRPRNMPIICLTDTSPADDCFFFLPFCSLGFLIFWLNLIHNLCLFHVL